MLFFSLKKHYIKNFKNFIISNYCINFKQFFFKQKIHIVINFSKKTFFLAIYLLYTFCIFKFKHFKIQNKIHLFLPTFYFIFVFNIFLYPFLLNLNFLKKISKNIISINFNLNNFFLYPISTFFYKFLYWIKKQTIILNMKLKIQKKLYKYFQFFFNFLQIPVFFKNDKI